VAPPENPQSTTKPKQGKTLVAIANALVRVHHPQTLSSDGFLYMNANNI